MHTRPMRLSLDIVDYLELLNITDPARCEHMIRSTWSDPSITLESLRKYADEQKAMGNTCFPTPEDTRAETAHA